MNFHLQADVFEKYLNLLNSSRKNDENFEFLNKFFKIEKNCLVVNCHVEILAKFLNFLSNPRIYYSKVFSIYMGIANVFPNIELRSTPEKFHGKSIEYLCMSFYKSITALNKLTNSVVPEDILSTINNSVQKRLVRVLPELIQNIKENNITIKKYVKALMLGIFKSLSLYEIPFSQKNISHVKKFIIDIPAKNIRRTKKGNAFLIGTIAKLIKPSSKFSQEELDQCRNLSKFHINAFLAYGKCPKLLINSIELLINTENYEGIKSYDETGSTSNSFLLLSTNIIYILEKCLSIQLPATFKLTKPQIIKIIAFFTKTIINYGKIKPKILQDTLSVYAKYATQPKEFWDNVNTLQFNPNLSIIFEDCLSLIMKSELKPLETNNSIKLVLLPKHDTDKVLGKTCSYLFLMETFKTLYIMQKNKCEIKELIMRMKFVLRLVSKIDNEEATIYILSHMFALRSFFASLAALKPFEELMKLISQLCSQFKFSHSILGQCLAFLSNLFQDRIFLGFPCNAIGLAFKHIAENHNSKPSLLLVLKIVAKLFCSIGLEIENRRYEQVRIEGEEVNRDEKCLGELVSGLVEVSKSNAKFEDYNFVPSNDMVIIYNQIWQYIILHKMFTTIGSTKIQRALTKLAYHTPPLVVNAGKSIGAFLVYEKFIEKHFFKEMHQQIMESLFPLGPMGKNRMMSKVNAGHIIYLGTVDIISRYNLDYLKHIYEKYKGYVHIARPYEKKKIGDYSSMLPNLFTYLYDNGVHYQEPLLYGFTSLISKYFALYFTELEKMYPCQMKENLISQDVCFLLKSTCNLFKVIRKKAFLYLEKYTSAFPHCLYIRIVMFTFLDIVGSLYNELYYPFDSLSHILTLPHSKQQILLTTDKKKKQKVFLCLVKLLSDMFLRCAILNESELTDTFRNYIHMTIAELSIHSFAHFGISFMQNLYANYKNCEVSMPTELISNCMPNTEQINQFMKKQIKNKMMIVTVDDIIEKSEKIKQNSITLDSSYLANSFKYVLGKSSQYSQLQTKYYGIVEGMLQNFQTMSKCQFKSAPKLIETLNEPDRVYHLVFDIILEKLKKILLKLEVVSYYKLGSSTESVQSFRLNKSNFPFDVKTFKNLHNLIKEQDHNKVSEYHKYNKRFHDVNGELTALLIILNERAKSEETEYIKKTRDILENKILPLICEIPMLQVSKETINSGVFCWNWLLNSETIQRKTLLNILEQNHFRLINCGGIFKSNSVSICYNLAKNKDSSVLDLPKYTTWRKFIIHLAPLRMKIMNHLADQFQTNPFKEDTNENYEKMFFMNLFATDVYEGQNEWYSFLLTQLRLVTVSNPKDIKYIYNILMSSILQETSSAHTMQYLDIQIRFRIFNLCLIILKTISTSPYLFLHFPDAALFQYLAYEFILRYFNHKYKFNYRLLGSHLQNDTELLNEAIELISKDENLLGLQKPVNFIQQQTEFPISQPNREVQNNKKILYIGNSKYTEDDVLTSESLNPPLCLPNGCKYISKEHKFSTKSLSAVDFRDNSIFNTYKNLLNVLINDLTTDLENWNTVSMGTKPPKVSLEKRKYFENQNNMDNAISIALKISPQFALSIIQRLFYRPQFSEGMAQKIVPLISQNSKFYYTQTIAYQKIIEYCLAQKESASEGEKAKWDNYIYKHLGFFKPSKIPILINYLTHSYHSHDKLQLCILGQLEKMDSANITFYLSQLMQCLRSPNNARTGEYLIRMALKYPSFCHTILWMSGVEEIERKPPLKRKVALPFGWTRDPLPAFIQTLKSKIIYKMSPAQKFFFETQNGFFEKITSISGILKVKEQSKQEKKAIIQKYLEKYNRSIPPYIYLPTNPEYRVVGIVTNSGMPMQSHARVPILISFNVISYSGPDNDPILMANSSDFTATNPTNLHSNATSQKNTSMTTNYTGNNPFMIPALSYHQPVTSNELSAILNPTPSPLSRGPIDYSAITSKLVGRMKEETEGPEIMTEEERKTLYPKKSTDSASFNVPLISKPDEMIFKIAEDADELDIITSKKEEEAEEEIKEEEIVPMVQDSKVVMRKISFEDANIQDIEESIDKGEGVGIIPLTPCVHGIKALEGNSYLKHTPSELFQHFTKTLSTPTKHKNNLYDMLDMRGNPRINSEKPISLNFFQHDTVKGVKRKSSLKFNDGTTKLLQESPLVRLKKMGSFAENFHTFHRVSVNDPPPSEHAERSSETPREGKGEEENLVPKVISCIFKTKDDVRQDFLSLQIIKLFQEIFKKQDLDLYLYPYRVLSNISGQDQDIGGIIECVPNTSSRDQLGKAFDRDLYHYFIDKFGKDTSPEFKIARKNFIKSLAAYSIVSYILQIKDRHNGNILVDKEGHIVHIDFGFIFDISPAHDARFESAHFKLTFEMIRILGGNEKTEAYNLFVNLATKGFLATRLYADVIINAISPMFHSGLPCFKPKSIKKLVKRFKLNMTSTEATKFMRDAIHDAHNKFTTRFYDKIQAWQNNIHY